MATASTARDAAWTLDAVFGLFPALRALQSRSGKLLSGGEQQMLAVARTHAADQSAAADPERGH